MKTATTPRGLATACAMALAFFSLPAAAVNKCTGPDGTVTFQDAPCAGKGEAIKVRPASGSTSSVSPLAANAIAQGKVFVGMTAAEVRRSWGAPTKVNTTLSGGSRSEQWVYDRGNFRSQYVYLDNGIVRTIQSPE